jgi:hypothetical protein
MIWWREIAMPDPQSCKSHLTAAERMAYDDDIPRREAENADFELAFMVLYASDPACWSWPEPDGLDMMVWQDGRCAICGSRDVLALTTITGQPSSAASSAGPATPSKASGMAGCGRVTGSGTRLLICGLVERDWNPFTREYAEPPPPYDPWRDNPMKGIGL